MRQVAIGLAVTLATLGCSSKSDETARYDPAPVGSNTGSAAPVVIADAGTVTADAETLKQHMGDHFTAVSELHRATVRGQLVQVKQRAQWIADHDEPHQLDAWKPFVADMKQAAREISAAPDLPATAMLAAKLARTCSRCHEQLAAPVAFAWEEVPASSPALAVQMKRHEWATARLWEGLIGPSDTMWAEGGSVLASFQVDVAAIGGDKRAEVTRLAERARSLARRAMNATDLDARAAVYGELLATCAGCHAVARPAAVP